MQVHKKEAEAAGKFPGNEDSARGYESVGLKAV
jgi:hypothetical protein